MQTHLDPSLWAHYPMGPRVRDYLGISSDEYSGDQAPRPDEATLKRFQQELLAAIPGMKPSNQDHFIDLLEEFSNMGLAEAAICLADSYPEFTIDTDFRACLALGSAFMLERELVEAKLLMKQAQALAPMELAPFINLAQIAYAEELDQEAVSWIEQGLSLDRNSFRLWELLASIYLLEEASVAGERLRKKAEDIQSYAGLSLAAEVIDPNDHLLKAQLLDDAFHSGARDDDFLIEYTAVLGMAQQFEKIPNLVYRLEHLEKKKLPWKLYAHAAQALLALDKEEEAEPYIRKASLSQDIPPEILRDLQQIHQEQTNQ